MLAQRRLEAVRPVMRSARQSRGSTAVKRLLAHQMFCVLFLAVLVFGIVSMYAGAYAIVMEKGYSKARLVSHLRELQMENESLRLKLDMLRQPDRIAAIAAASGMKQAQDMAYLRPSEQAHVAQNTQ